MVRPVSFIEYDSLTRRRRVPRSSSQRRSRRPPCCWDGPAGMVPAATVIWGLWGTWAVSSSLRGGHGCLVDASDTVWSERKSRDLRRVSRPSFALNCHRPDLTTHRIIPSTSASAWTSPSSSSYP